MLNIDQIYRPEWEIIYSLVLEITSICSIIMYPFVLFTVLFKAPNSMRVYKWMLANAITWSFLFELLLCAFKPYPLLPFTMGFPVGITKMLGSTGAYFQFEFLTFIYGTICTNLSLCALYRYSKVLPENEGYWLSKDWHIFAIMLGMFIILVLPPEISIFLSRIPEESLKEKLSTEIIGIDPNFINNLALFGYSGTINPWFYVFQGSVLLSNTILFIVILVTILSLYRILKKSQKQKRWSPKTLSLQWMLFKTFFLSLISAVIFLVMPILFFSLLALTKIEAFAAPMASISVIFVSLHSLCDYAILMYFIVPYRKFCIKCFQKVYSFVNRCKKHNQTTKVFKVKTVVERIVVPSTAV